MDCSVFLDTGQDSERVACIHSDNCITHKAVALQQKLQSTIVAKRLDHLEDMVCQVQNMVEDKLSSIHVKLKDLTRQQNHQVRLGLVLII